MNTLNWRPTTFRQPPAGRVLIKDRNGEVCFGQYVNNLIMGWMWQTGWGWQEHYTDPKYITHWMPKP